MKKNCITKMYLSRRSPKNLACQKDANKKKVTQTTKNDERTAKTHKNPNGNITPTINSTIFVKSSAAGNYYLTGGCVVIVTLLSNID